MSFASDVRKFNKRLKGKSEQVIRGTTLELFKKIVYRTPVGNPEKWKPYPSGKPRKPPKNYRGGTLRGAWQVESGRPGTRKTDIDKSGDATIAKNRGKIMRAPIGKPLYITNNMPYAMAIEFGHSWYNAPAGMVRVSIAEFARIVSKEAKKAR